MQNDPNTGSALSGLSLSDLLPLGYLYLLVLGIASDSIYYGLLGINIISYSNVLDVLLSPLVHLTDSLVFLGVIMGFPFLLYFLLRWSERRQQASAKPSSGIDELPLTMKWVVLSAWIIFSAFIGFGLGSGVTLKSKMEKGDVKASHLITFTNGEAVKGKLVGQNSSYLFYAAEGDPKITVAPVVGNVVKIEVLK